VFLSLAISCCRILLLFNTLTLTETVAKPKSTETNHGELTILLMCKKDAYAWRYYSKDADTKTRL
jgi:hypothetical protein